MRVGDRILCLAAFLILFRGPAIWAQPARGAAGLGEWPRATPQELGMDETKLARARDHALKGGGSGIVIHRGKLVYSWGDQKARYDLKSTTKSIGVTALGLALKDAKVELTDPTGKYYPEFGVTPEANRQTGWLEEITLLHLAAQTAGFDKPGGFEPLLFRPGTKWSYSDGGPNWLADCLTLVYGRDLQELMFERVFTPLGIDRDDLSWRENAYRPKTLNGIARREFGSGVHANVDAMARIGFLYLHAGLIGSRQVLPPGFVAMARTPLPRFKGVPVVKPERYPNASDHYGLLWWNNSDGSLPNIPRDAFWSWGLYDSHIVVIPSLDLVVARAGKSLSETGEAMPEKLSPLIGPIVEALDPAFASVKPPYPPSPVIESVEWASADTIRRSGSDCDNFPATWADDGNLYTAYGDCRGFFPLRPHKLGMGFARITGPPDAFQAANIPSETGENTGMGAQGRKASGMLMLDGVLYMWARNAGNSQLAWSTDYAKTWTWSDWKLTTSFGHPTFLNFGKNYAGARDQYVYIYSPDQDSAYTPSSSMVMARVRKDRIRDRGAYEFFKALDPKGNPVWTKDIAQRGPVFVNAPDRCYRTQISYNAGLKRYFLNQILPGQYDTRFQGGFGIYDAPEPWGPWTTVYFTRIWDVGPGENQHFPPKWMSADGRTMHLIFSGDDVFSVRKVTLKLRQGGVSGRTAASSEPLPSPGQKFIPSDVDLAHPVYETSFDDESALKDWILEGGRRMSVAGGNLVLESEPGTVRSQTVANHLVCWLKREMPADFLLEFTVRPENRKQGLNIVFFNTRGVGGESIFAPSLQPRDGTFVQYHSRDLNGYHISYWAAGRGTAHIRKNKGFHLVTAGEDLVTGAPEGEFQTIRIYKRGGRILLMVDDVVSVAWDDDGKTYGPAWSHSGWIGLRQMAHTVRCEYGHLKVFPLKP